jgi:hypothetical protein
MYLMIGLPKGKEGMPEYLAGPAISACARSATHKSATHKSRVQTARNGSIIRPFDDGPAIGEECQLEGLAPEF